MYYRRGREEVATAAAAALAAAAAAVALAAAAAASAATNAGSAVAVHKPQAVAMVLKVLEGEDCDENEGVDGEGAASGAIGALRWLVAEETRTEGNVPGYIRNVEARRTPPNVEARFPAPPEVEARFPTPPTSPNVGAALGASRPATPSPATPVQRAASPVASPATPVHRVGWDSPRPTSPHRALKAPSHPRPSDAVLASHKLMVRGGFIRQLDNTAGLYMMLPLGLRVLDKIEAVVDVAMRRAGGNKLAMPILLPAALWTQGKLSTRSARRQVGWRLQGVCFG